MIDTFPMFAQHDQPDMLFPRPPNFLQESAAVLTVHQVPGDFFQVGFPVYAHRPAVQHVVPDVQFLHRPFDAMTVQPVRFVVKICPLLFFECHPDNFTLRVEKVELNGLGS